VLDKPKVLGAIATAFGEFDVSLAAMEMRVLGEGLGEIVFLTHVCQESRFRDALQAIEREEVVKSVSSWIRVVDPAG